MHKSRSTTAGQSIKLRASFQDELGHPTAADNVRIHIYEPEVEIDDFNNAFLVSGIPAYLGEGIYEYEFATPSNATPGQWIDVWEGDLENYSLEANLSFYVGNAGNINPIDFQLFENNLVEITVASGIQSTDGTLLEEEYVLEFLTTTSPSFTDVRKVRLEIGGFLGDLPDLTLQMAILEASLEADTLIFTPAHLITNNKLFIHARREYTTCLAGSMLLTNLGTFLLRSKSLGDLSVQYDTNGIRDANSKLKDCLEKWLPQLMAGGGAKARTQPSMVVKGSLDRERPVVSRSWQSTDERGTGREIPAANTKVTQQGNRRAETTWKPRLSKRGNKKWW